MYVYLGLTETDRAGDYVPSLDGFRAGAERQEIVLDIPDEIIFSHSEHDLCEALFVATNAPVEVIARDSIAAAMLWAIGAGRQFYRALSIGDTVTFGPAKVNHWALDRIPGRGTGWVPVTRL